MSRFLADTPTIVMTGARGAFAAAHAPLDRMGLHWVDAPLLSFEPPEDWRDFDAALARLGDYGAAAFTSPRAAVAFVERARLHALRPTGAEFWAGGEMTAAPIRELGVDVRLPAVRPSANVGLAASLANGMLAADVRGPVLFPCGSLHLDELPARLRAARYHVDEVICYRSVVADDEMVRDAIALGDVLVVTSPSVARRIAALRPTADPPLLVAVGPSTAAAADAHGWAPDAILDQPSADSLVKLFEYGAGART